MEFKELCELKGKAYYGIIREISKKLNTKIVEVAYKDAAGYHFMQAPWLSSITYHAKEGTVTIKLNPEIKPFFEGKPFTETEFYFLIKFTSQYAERLYELIKALAHKSIIDFDIADLRKRLGIGDKQYINFNMLKSRVLAPAIQDINEFIPSIHLASTKAPNQLAEGSAFGAITKRGYLTPLPPAKGQRPSALRRNPFVFIYNIAKI